VCCQILDQDSKSKLLYTFKVTSRKISVVDPECTFTPQICRPLSEVRYNRSLSIYDRQQRKAEAKKAWIEQQQKLRQEAEDREFDKLPFKPNLRKSRVREAKPHPSVSKSSKDSPPKNTSIV
jgi:gamma-glutamylcysteine synthetase